jgi:hypothetical protein
MHTSGLDLTTAFWGANLSASTAVATLPLHDWMVEVLLGH